jgi:hypothetical protein
MLQEIAGNVEDSVIKHFRSSVEQLHTNCRPAIMAAAKEAARVASAAVVAAKVD